MIRCKKCLRKKPESEFLWCGRKGKLRVKICFPCASENMRAYWATRMVGRKPEDFKESAD